MNDFFSHLVARSFDQAEGIGLVHPRLMAIFEPSREAAQAWDFKETPPGPDCDCGFEEARREIPQRQAISTVTQSDFSPARCDDRFEKSAAPIPGGDESRSQIDTISVIRRPGPSESVPAEKAPAESRPLHISAGTVVTPEEATSSDADRSLKERTVHTREQDDLQRNEVTENPQRHSSRTFVQGNPVVGLLSTRPQREQSPRSDHASQPMSLLFGMGSEVAMERIRTRLESAKAPEWPEEAEPAQRLGPVVDRGLPLPNDTGGIGRPRIPRPIVRPNEAVFVPRRATVARKDDAEPAPTINVSIGRVEVRAVMTAKVENRKTTSSAMSLSEYLAGGKGGR